MNERISKFSLMVLAGGVVLAAGAGAQVVAGSASNYMSAEPAPIEHAYSASTEGGQAYTNGRPGEPGAMREPRLVATTRQVAGGVYVRSSAGAEVQAKQEQDQTTTIQVQRGTANVLVRHPEEGSQILVALPGGETALLKDGLYTFNAADNTVRVVDGEANAMPPSRGHGVTVKGGQQYVFGAGRSQAEDTGREATYADVLPGGFEGGGRAGYGGGYESSGYEGAGYGYGDGFVGGYPYAGLGYGYEVGPYGYGFGGPFGYGYGYPYGLGVGIGFGGGFYGGRGFYGGGRGFYGGGRGFAGGHGIVRR